MLNYYTGSSRNRGFISVHVDAAHRSERSIHLAAFPGGLDALQRGIWRELGLPSSARPGLEVSSGFKDEIVAVLQELANDHPGLQTMFVSTAGLANPESWTQFMHETLETRPQLAGSLEVVCNRRPSGAPRATAPLLTPLRIACEPDLSTHLLKAAGYFRAATVREQLIRIEPWSKRGALPAADILVLSEGDRAKLRLTPERLAKATRRTRLVIVLDPTPESRFVLPRNLLRDIAVVVFPLNRGITAGDALHALLEEIVHDHPLSDALRIARENLKYKHPNAPFDLLRWTDRPRLYADPVADQALRLSTLVPQIRKFVSTIAPAAYGTNFRHLALRMDRRIPKRTMAKLSSAFGTLDSAAAPLRSALRKQVNFDGESLGLVPLADIMAAAASMKRALAAVQPDLEQLLSDSKVVAAIESQQARRLDAEMLNRGTDGSAWPLSLEYPVPQRSLLRLRVHIGQRGENSLLVNEPPAIDAIVPPLKGEEHHELLITVFPKDFTLESPATQAVRLSRLGGTKPVEWDLQAPEVLAAPPDHAKKGPIDATQGLGWTVGTQATLRINVYFRNQLLQSFKLTADVGPWRELPKGSRSVTVECDYSQTERFGELDDVAPRLLSLSLNADDDTHTLMMAKDKVSAALRWSSGQLAGFTDAIRNELFDAMVKNGAPRFDFDATTLALRSQSHAEFEPSVRALAAAGGRLADQLYALALHRPELAQLLDRIKAADADVLQIEAADSTYAFPWPLIYDFDRPADADSQPVCRGQLANGKPCGCDSAPAGYCLRGFWGLRLIVEQRSPGPTPSAVKGRIAAAASTPVVGLVTSVNDAFVTNWVTALPTRTKLTFKPFSNTALLLDTFRVGTERPNVIVFLGHHRNAGSPLLPDHQLLSPAKTPILRLADFRGKNAGPWDSPRSLVFLLACAAGTTRVDTGPSLAAALLALGSAGVLATECTVHTPMVARVSRDIMAKLAANATIGSATRETLLELAQEGCPLGLAFTFHGIAEASLP